MANVLSVKTLSVNRSLGRVSSRERRQRVYVGIILLLLSVISIFAVVYKGVVLLLYV